MNATVAFERIAATNSTIAPRAAGREALSRRVARCHARKAPSRKTIARSALRWETHATASTCAG